MHATSFSQGRPGADRDGRRARDPCGSTILAFAWPRGEPGLRGTCRSASPGPRGRDRADRGAARRARAARSSVHRYADEAAAARGDRGPRRLRRDRRRPRRADPCWSPPAPSPAGRRPAGAGARPAARTTPAPGAVDVVPGDPDDPRGSAFGVRWCCRWCSRASSPASMVSVLGRPGVDPGRPPSPARRSRAGARGHGDGPELARRHRRRLARQRRRARASPCAAVAALLAGLNALLGQRRARRSAP